MLALTIQGVTETLDDEQRDEAMRRYWEAHQAGDVTAKLERADTPDPDDDPPQSPTAPGAVSAVAVDRIRRQEGWLAAAGFQVSPPIYAPGTRVLPIGDRNFALARQKLEAMPSFPGASAAVTDVIRAEEREDWPARLQELYMLADGRIEIGYQKFGLEAEAFQQLCQLGGFGAGTKYLIDHCAPELRATNVNRQIRAQDRQVVLRMRGAENERSIFAVVTPSYTVVDTDEVLATAAPLLADAHTELVYTGLGAHANALFMPELVQDLAAGDIFRAGVRVSTDDSGRGRIRIEAIVWRNRCLNLLILGQGVVETVSQVHRGPRERLLLTIEAGIAKAREAIGPFLEAWSHARTLKVDVKDELRALVNDRTLSISGPKARERVHEAFDAAWQQEPGDTLAAVANAVSRAAHETPFFPLDLRAELERRAARLVLVGA